MTVEVRNINHELSLTGGYKMAALVTGWRKNCFTFKTGNYINVSKYAFRAANEFTELSCHALFKTDLKVWPAINTYTCKLQKTHKKRCK